MEFSRNFSGIMHLDINSCFATIEQQANPFLRGKPVVVAAFTTDRGTVLASSIEAKKLGIKTGMLVLDAKKIYPKVVVLSPDAPKYRSVHMSLRKLISDYTNDFCPKSIDEFAINLNGMPCLQKKTVSQIAVEIKKRIKEEIGDWITVSIGIAPNRYLAKIAAGLIKPDGLVEINSGNYLDTYSKLKLTDLTGIKTANAIRLNSVGINTVTDFYNSPVWKLKLAFKSITGYYWYLRLRGYEVDDVEFERKSFGNSVALGPNLSTISDLSPILARLIEKTGFRLRSAGFTARGIHLSLLTKDGRFWHKGRTLTNTLFDTRDILKEGLKLLYEANPKSPIRNIAITCFSLSKREALQTELFSDVAKKEKLTKAYDLLNKKWGPTTVGVANSFKGDNLVLDRIAFGGVKEL